MGRLTIFSNSYIFPHTLETIAMTSTKYGISAKDLIGKHGFTSVREFSEYMFLTKLRLGDSNSGNGGRANPIDPKKITGPQTTQREAIDC